MKRHFTKNEMALRIISILAVVVFVGLSAKSIFGVAPKLLGNHGGIEHIEKNGENK